MRFLPVLAVLCASLSSLLPAQNIPLSEYRTRRDALRKDLQGTVVLFAKTVGPDEVYGYVQEPNFYYLTGWTQPNAVLLIDKNHDVLFLPHRNERAEIFYGRRAAPEDADAPRLTGFDHVQPMEKFESELSQSLQTGENVYGLPHDPGTEKLRSFLVFRQVSDAATLIAKLRIKKSEAEIAAIQHATDVSIEAHRAAWKRMQPGLYEYQVAATFSDVVFENGCERHAYSPIVGSGPNSTVLHYSTNTRRMDRGEVVVMDAAAECGSYASDITRTIPVGGKFSARQREIYNVVLGAQNAAIAAIKPGVKYYGDENSIAKIAKDYINSHGKDLHGEPLGKYFTHGLGHPVGIDVHDPQVDEPLEAGMIYTVEPGIYIPEESIGIRIEDVVLVTDKGAKILSAVLPREADEVEKALAK